MLMCGGAQVDATGWRCLLSGTIGCGLFGVGGVATVEVTAQEVLRGQFCWGVGGYLCFLRELLEHSSRRGDLKLPGMLMLLAVHCSEQELWGDRGAAAEGQPHHGAHYMFRSA